MAHQPFTSSHGTLYIHISRHVLDWGGYMGNALISPLKEHKDKLDSQCYHVGPRANKIKVTFKLYMTHSMLTFQGLEDVSSCDHTYEEVKRSLRS